MATIEILRGKKTNASGEALLTALTLAMREAGDTVVQTTNYRGQCEWLCLFGVGLPVHNEARKLHVAKGRHALLWDLGYFAREKLVGPLRMSIDTDHPQQWLDKAPDDGARWDSLGIELREDADPDGPIILVGLGQKSRKYLRQPKWEQKTYATLVDRFPGRRIIYRPKGDDDLVLPCARDGETPIAELLKGAALVVARHSNVCVDATIAGVPFVAEEGAAMWLAQRAFTRENRDLFLRRLAYFQWRPDEAAQAWTFSKGLIK